MKRCFFPAYLVSNRRCRRTRDKYRPQGSDLRILNVPVSMKKYTLLFLFILFTSSAFAQQPVTFDQMVSRMTKPYQEDTFPRKLFPRDEKYTISLSDQPLPLVLKDTIIKTSRRGMRSIAGAVLFRDNLVILSASGRFTCYRPDDLSRNKEFEKKLNTKIWRSHQILNNQLIAQSAEQPFYFTAANTWEIYKTPATVKETTPLYEDEDYFCYSECHGEWGGMIYFFDKRTGSTYFTGAGCARSVLKKAGKYYVLSSLRHMSGSSDLVEIADPRKLSECASEMSYETVRWMDRQAADTAKHAVSVFDVYGLVVHAIFSIEDRFISLGSWRKQTFLCEIDQDMTTIVHPFFNESFSPYSASTNGYGDIQLVNISTGTWNDTYVAITLIIKGNKITRITWNQPLFDGE